ncbi:MAG: relaxase/mobilization nuclease domain-containing protein, partial [Butyrivibrio sp.]|nr:relaxase/mobilization nuclease domain-containing protein [Butyrivibrio sp.]
MAATKLIAIHQNKGLTLEQTLGIRCDYIKNKDKTDDGRLVTSYSCNPDLVDEEFLLSKKEYQQNGCVEHEGDIIAYHIRQAFKPGEITPEEANRIGYETAMRFTKGNHA